MQRSPRLTPISSLAATILAAILLVFAAPCQAVVETGIDDFRVSGVGTPEDPNIDANQPVVAYNPDLHEYLVVWWGDAGTDNVFEIRGQRIDAATGQPVGPNDFQISNMANGNPTYSAFEPDVVYNTVRSEYLVVWHGDDHSNGVDDEFEIFGQRLNPDGSGIGGDFQISQVGTPGDTTVSALRAAVAHDSVSDRYLVVWFGDDPKDASDDEFEIYAQFLDGEGTEISDDDFRISFTGIPGDATFTALDPDVAFDPDSELFLVVWHGDDNLGDLVDEEFEIFGRLVGFDGLLPRVRLSEQGGTGDPDFDAFRPTVAYDSKARRFLVVWDGDDNIDGMVDGEFEIRGRTVTSASSLGSLRRISTMGGSGTPIFGASTAAVTTLSDGGFLVAWSGDEIFNDEFEIFVQEVDGRGVLRGTRTEISDMGPDGTDFDGIRPALGSAPGGRILAVWSGSDPLEGGVPGAMDEFEIFGQLLLTDFIFSNGFESGNSGAWSSTVP